LLQDFRQKFESVDVCKSASGHPVYVTYIRVLVLKDIHYST